MYYILDAHSWIAVAVITVVLLIGIPIYFSASKSFRDLYTNGQQSGNSKTDKSKPKFKLIAWLEDERWIYKIFGIFAALIIGVGVLGGMVILILSLIRVFTSK
jgi:hypothetical protein